MWAWLLTLTAVAGTDVVEVDRLVQAEPADVYAALSELERWNGIWSLDPGGLKHHVHEDALLWSSGVRERGSLRITDPEADTSVSYTVAWSQTADLATPSPPAHSGQLLLEPEGGATRVRWTVSRESKRGDKLAGVSKRLETELNRAADRLAAVVAEPRAEAAPLTEFDAVVLWNGFHHRWTYNHRINRSGDGWRTACTDGDCTTTWFHAAASGSGQDRATFDGSATALVGPDIRSLHGAGTLWLDGKEGDVLTDRHCTPLPEGTPDGPALLAGYDMDAVEQADSLWELAIRAERDGNQVCTEATAKVACRTPECGTEALATYRIEVPWTVVMAPDLQVATETITQEQTWKADTLLDEPDPAAHALERTLPSDPDRPHAVGISGFSVALDGPLHTRGLDIAIRPGDQTEDGLALGVDLFYVQWGPVEMAPLTVAQFAHEGRATLSVDLVGLQPAAGCARTLAADGQIYWPGKSADASVPTAVHEATLDLPDCPDPQ